MDRGIPPQCVTGRGSKNPGNTKKNRNRWGWQSGLAQACACPRQRIAQITEKDLITWNKGDHTPKKNANQCDPEKEALIVHLVKQEFDASYNVTAKHAAMITGDKVSANLVKGVRKRNGLQKKTVSKKKFTAIKSHDHHVVSVDVVRVEGTRIFGFIQDKTKAVYHHLASAQTSKEACKGLKQYIIQYGKPDAVRSDHGSEFRGELRAFLKSEGIRHVMPLPYNPKANGFIERYFRTLRKTLFRRLKARLIKISQTILDEFAFIWNYCRQSDKQTGKTPAEMLGLSFPSKMLERFRIAKQSAGSWTFWHIQGVHGLLHAYLREEMLQNPELNGQQKIA